MAKKFPIRCAETGDLYNPTNVWYNRHPERVSGDFANSIRDLPGSNVFKCGRLKCNAPDCPDHLVKCF